MSSVRRLTPKHIMGGPISVHMIPPEVADLDLYTIYGIAHGIRQGESNYGPWTALVGRFEAVRLDTGEVVQGPQAFLPEPYNGMVAEKLKGNESVKFSFTITLARDESQARGYIYNATPQVNAAENDELAELRHDAQKALPKPESKKK